MIIIVKTILEMTVYDAIPTCICFLISLIYLPARRIWYSLGTSGWSYTICLAALQEKSAAQALTASQTRTKLAYITTAQLLSTRHIYIIKTKHRTHETNDD